MRSTSRIIVTFLPGLLPPLADLLEEFADPQTLRRDLQTLSKFYYTDMVRLLGEPLLHPNILEIIAIAKESKIADEVRLCTNGLLLWKMPDEFWQGLNRVEVSVYPDREMSPRSNCGSATRRPDGGARCSILVDLLRSPARNS